MIPVAAMAAAAVADCLMKLRRDCAADEDEELDGLSITKPFVDDWLADMCWWDARVRFRGTRSIWISTEVRSFRQLDPFRRPNPIHSGFGLGMCLVGARTLVRRAVQLGQAIRNCWCLSGERVFLRTKVRAGVWTFFGSSPGSGSAPLSETLSETLSIRK